MSALNKFSIIILVAIFLAGLNGDEGVLEAKVNKEKVETGEVFSYHLKIEGYFDQPQVKLPRFEGFEVASQSQSQSYSFEQGRQKLIMNLTYFLFASEPGTYTLKEVILEDNGKKFQTPPITIEVYGEPIAKKQKLLPYIEKGTNL